MTSKKERNRVDLGGSGYTRKKTQEEIEREQKYAELSRLHEEQEAIRLQELINKKRRQVEESKAKLEQPQQPENEAAKQTAKPQIAEPPTENQSIDSFFSSYDLTEREIEVAKLLREGCSATEVSMHLVITGHTAKSHTDSIRRKLKQFVKDDEDTKVMMQRLLDNLRG